MTLHSFNTIYLKLFPALKFYAMKFVNEQQAEDIVQDSFIKLWIGKEINEGSIKSWLYTAVRNAALNINLFESRAAKSHKEILYLTSEWDYPLIDTTVIEERFERLKVLPPAQYKVVIAILNGKSINEISINLGITTKTVLNLKQRALRELDGAIVRHGRGLIPKLVEKTDVEGNLVKEYISAKAAADANGVNVSNMRQYINRNSIAAGFKYRYKP